MKTKMTAATAGLIALLPFPKWETQIFMCLIILILSWSIWNMRKPEKKDSQTRRASS